MRCSAFVWATLFLVAGGSACTGTTGDAGGDDIAGDGGSAGQSDIGGTEGGTGGGGGTAAGAGGGMTVPGGGGSTAAGGSASGGAGGGTSGGAGGIAGGAGAIASGGASGMAGGAGAGAFDPGSAVLAVGWGGVRVVSYDKGLTWRNRVSIDSTRYGDKVNLFYAAIYAGGLFVAGGQKIFTSPDGVTWTERQHPGPGTGWWMGSLSYGNGLFVASGGCAATSRSRDGITWQRGGQTRPGNCPTGGDHHGRSAFGNGQFAAPADDGTVYVSTDALAWTVFPGLRASSVAFCNGAFRNSSACPTVPAGGPYVRGGQIGEIATTIEHSVDGKIWRMVHRDTNLFTAFAFGIAQ